MIAQKGLILLVTLCAFASLAYSQSETYSFSILNNGTCQAVRLGQCVPCQYSQFYPISYYSVTQSESTYYAYEYSDSACQTEYSYVGFYSGQCNNDFYGSCYFFSHLQSIETIKLTLSSAVSDISVSYFGEDYYAQISPSKITAQGVNLSGFQIHSDGELFFVERQLSLTQYSTNIGIFNIGETYTRDPFTFSVTSETEKFPLNYGSEVTTVTLEPFYKAKVVGRNVYQTYLRNEGEIVVYVDNENPTLKGLAVGNPFYSIYNMTIYEPFGSNNDATLVFQFEASSSPFFTVECYEDSYSNGDTDFTDYECEVGSLFYSFSSFSGSFSSIEWGSFGSFGSYSYYSVDRVGAPKKINPDNMAFSLF